MTRFSLNYLCIMGMSCQSLQHNETQPFPKSQMGVASCHISHPEMSPLCTCLSHNCIILFLRFRFKLNNTETMQHVTIMNSSGRWLLWQKNRVLPQVWKKQLLTSHGGHSIKAYRKTTNQRIGERGPWSGGAAEIHGSGGCLEYVWTVKVNRSQSWTSVWRSEGNSSCRVEIKC